MNSQYIRGFFNENKEDDLHDYLLTAVEWRILNITLGLRWIEGRTGTSFAEQKGQKSLYFKARYTF